MSKKVLDYYDILLRQGDIDTLRGSGWLNDQIISFYFEYLAREVYQDQPFALLGGSLTCFLAHTDVDEGQHTAKVLQLDMKDLLLLAVNDATNMETSNSGSHWSLLVYDNGERAFRHYDSSRGLNARPAQKLAQKLQKMLRLQLIPVTQPNNFPSQSNAHDCGVYVLAAAELICQGKQKQWTWEGIEKELLLELSPAATCSMRSRVLKLIQEKTSVKDQS